MEYCSQCKKLQAQGQKVCPDDGAEIILAKDLPTGVMLGVYRFEKKLGQGGMGAVYEAEHTVLKKRCAIKILLPKFAAQPEVCARFLQEARATNAIQHEHIVQIYDFGRSPDGGAFLVMEYLEGEPLDKTIKDKTKLSHEALVEIFYQLTDALATAHTSNVIHRDLKPENIFLLKNDRQSYFTKVLDFGVAKIQGDLAVPGLTRAGTVVGTPQYISPEQLTGKPVSGAADIYSLGVIFYQCATGVLPFKGPRLSDFAQQHLFDTPKPPTDLTPDLHEGLSSLILRMLAKKPEERPSSMQEIAQALSALRVGKADPLLITPPPMTIEKMSGASSSGWWAAGAAALIFVLIAAYLVLFAPPPPPRDAKAEAFAAAASGDFSAILPYAEQQVAAAFASTEVDRRRAAISATEASGAVKNAGWLTTALQDPDPEVKKLAANAISTLEQEGSKEALYQAYQSSGKRLQPQLLFALLGLSPKDTQLIDLANKELDNPTTRFDAAVALAKTNHTAAIEILLSELDTTNKERALKAAEALLQTEQRERAKQFLLLQLSAPDSFTLRIAKQLAAADVPEGLAMLVQASKEKGGFEALVYRAELLDKNARPGLLKALESEHQREAILALARFHNKEDLGRLVPLLQNQAAAIQDAAAQAILTIALGGEKQ